MKRWLFFLALLAPGASLAAEWSTPTMRCSTSGNIVRSTWTEASTTDSGRLTVACWTKCVNTGSTDFTVYSTDPAGAITNEYLGPIIDTGSCSPDAVTDTCGEVSLEPGDYVFSPDATGASAACMAGSR